MLFNLVVAKRQNVNSSDLGVATDTCFTVLKMAEKMAIEKWHFQHRDGHTKQEVKKNSSFRHISSRNTGQILIKKILMSKLKELGS